MKRLSLFALAWLSLAASSHAATTEIQLGAQSPQFGYFADSPLDQITRNMGNHASVNRFRCSWDDSLGSGWDRGTMLYDKKRGLLKYYDVGGAGEMGEEYYRYGVLFTGVKPATLRAIVHKYEDPKLKDSDGGQLTFDFFGELSLHGARKFELEKFKRGY